MDCIVDVAFGFANSCPTGDFSAVEYEWIFWLSTLTSAAFVALAVLRVLYLCKCPLVVRPPAVLLIAKSVAAAALAGVRLGLLVIALRHTHARTSRLVASTALYFAASSLILVLSPLEHFKSNRPSILICSFLCLTFIYDLARCPSLWVSSISQNGGGNFASFRGLFTAAVVVQFLLLILESVKRRRWFGRDAAAYSPEETSSVLSLGLYSWLNPLLWKGYREPLAMEHLFALDRAISVERLDIPDTSISPESKVVSIRHILLWLAKPLGQALLLPVFPRLCLLGFTFCQPFFLQNLLRYLSASEDNSLTANGLVAVAVLTYTGIAISTALYWYYQERFQSLLRAFLISSIYRKTGSISHVGDGDSAAVTLMGADVERIYTGLRLMHEVWADIIQITLAAWLLYGQLGLAFLAPLIIVLLGFAGSFALSKRAVPYQSAWMARVQARIGVTSSVLANVKDIRISGMASPATELLQREREDELRVGERSRVLIAISASLSQLPQAVAPALAFAFGPRVLNETRAYMALSFPALLTAPLLVVLQSVPIIAACIACLRRIWSFLIQEGRLDVRVMGAIADCDEKANSAEQEADKGACLLVKNGSFGWTAESPTLKDINLSLPKSSITFVIGLVASGKSTLCRALLGEVPHMNGKVVVRSEKLAYCDQIPFLFNASIKENIIGYSSFDSVRYSDVIRATILSDDLKSLPAGDRTIIGTKGLSLSGGQRQRISLARALYHDADILVLDDIFNALDGSTQRLVCQSVFGRDGLLRKRGTTAIICTHSTENMSVADHVVTLSQDGTVAEQASITDSLQNRWSAGRIESSGAPKLLEYPSSPAIESSELVVEEAGATLTEATAPNGDNASPEVKLTPTPPPTVDVAVYRHWLSTIGFKPLLLYVVLVAGIGFCSNFPTVWVKLWSEDSTSLEPEHSFAFWIGIYALLGAGVIICVFPGGLIMLRTAVRLAGSDLHRATVETIMHSSLRFLSNTEVGKVLNLFSQDMNIMDTQLPRMVNNMCICLAVAIGQAVVIALSSAWLALSYPFFMALLWIVQRVYLPSSKRLRILDLEAKTPLYTNFLDTLAGLPTIRAFGWFPQQLAHNNALLDDSQRPSYLLAMVQQWLALTMNLIVALLAVILVVLATQIGSNAGSVGAGLVTLITLGSTMTTIVIAYTGLETSLGAISRLKSFEEETELEDEKEGKAIPDEQWPVGGSVHLQDVEASYNGKDRVLKSLNLEISAGEKLAICGRTGSGKSSILALLLRLIDPLPPSDPSRTGGRILVDGHHLSTIDHAVLRERVIAASQDAVFLPDGTSFRENIDPWASASDEECYAALHVVDIAALVKLKGGLDAPVNGSEFSAGQRQLFNLARVVLRRRVKLRQTKVNGGLLLLDEITSNADSATEQRVQAIIRDEFASYTVVMVTHRQQMAMVCDRVIVIDAGTVVEDGKPGELIHVENGYLRSLWLNGES